MAEELIDNVAAGIGSGLVRVDDVTTAAIELADRFPECELVEGAAAFSALVEERREALAKRVTAHAALELLAQDAEVPSLEPRVVNDLDGLRSLIDRLEDADRLVEATRDDARARAGVATDVAVHPSSIRDAAADVLDARADVLERQLEIDRLVAAARESGVGTVADEGDEDTGDDGTPEPVAPTPAWRPDVALTQSDEFRRAALVAAVALVVGVLALVATGSPIPLVLPGVAVCWMVMVSVRRRDRAYDEEIASRNLANVARLTDRAYGGAGLLDPGSHSEQDPARVAADRALAQASDRLAYAESAWRSLVGPDADVDDVESVVRARDASYGLSDEIVDELPSFRAASAHRRRLRAQWKLAWWALDRPVPHVADATDAVAALEAEGIDQILVEPRAVGGLTDAERATLDDLADGRSEEQLRASAAAVFPVVIVADPDGEIDEERFGDETAQLPDDVRFVVVAPAG